MAKVSAHDCICPRGLHGSGLLVGFGVVIRRNAQPRAQGHQYQCQGQLWCYSWFLGVVLSGVTHTTTTRACAFTVDLVVPILVVAGQTSRGRQTGLSSAHRDPKSSFACFGLVFVVVCAVSKGAVRFKAERRWYIYIHGPYYQVVLASPS